MTEPEPTPRQPKAMSPRQLITMLAVAGGVQFLIVTVGMLDGSWPGEILWLFAFMGVTFWGCAFAAWMRWQKARRG